MNNILIFPKKEKQKKPLPRQSVFYLGFLICRSNVMSRSTKHFFKKRIPLMNNFRNYFVD
ncbi:hypothetical protein OBA40_03425 [Alphaproteobacteria bacterium]|nr:hypothetical protein [Alphaproteobacteria bacterium]